MTQNDYALDNLETSGFWNLTHIHIDNNWTDAEGEEWCYKENGFYIIINSSRNMRTFKGNVGKINAITLKIIFEWLDKHKIPYDEVHVGKPWCGFNGLYVDDKTIRPSEFVNLSLEEINNIIKKEVK